MSRSKTSAVRMSAAEFEAKASELRLAGLTIRQIASRLDRSVSGTAQALERALARTQKDAGDSMEAWRAVEVARLDRLLVAVWPMAIKGNLGAVDRALRIAERRAKLLGLDASVDVSATCNLTTMTDEQLRRLARGA